jgi:hypothetical protein
MNLEWDSFFGTHFRHNSSAYFLLGMCKIIVYCEKGENVNEMRDRIVRAAECVTNEMLASTWRETENLLDVSCH